MQPDGSDAWMWHAPAGAMRMPPMAGATPGATAGSSPAPVAPSVPPRQHPQLQQLTEQQGGSHDLSWPTSQGWQTSQIASQIAANATVHEPSVAAAAADADWSMGMAESGVLHTMKHEFATLGVQDHFRADSPSVTWGLPDDDTTSPRPVLPPATFKRERAADCTPHAAATERAKRKDAEDDNKAERRAAVVEAFLREAGKRRPAINPEKFRSGSVRQRVAARQLQILRELRESARVGGQPLPEDLVCQELAEATATKCTEQRVSSQVAEASIRSNGVDGSESGVQAAGGLASVPSAIQVTAPLPDASKTSPPESENSEQGGQQQSKPVDEAHARHGEASAQVPYADSTLAVQPADDVQSSRTSDEQSVLDEPRCAAIAAQQAVQAGAESRAGSDGTDGTDFSAKTGVFEELNEMEAVSETPKRFARVLYDWTGGAEGDLNLHRDAIVTITDDIKPGFGWWSGSIDGEVGIFPRCFVEEMDDDAETETCIHMFEQELVNEEESFMAAIGIKKLPVPKPRVPSRPPKSRPPQPYELGQSVVANWNGQLTLATVLQAKFDMSTAPDEWSFRLHFEGWLSTHDTWFSVRYLMPYSLPAKEDAEAEEQRNKSKKAEKAKKEHAAGDTEKAKETTLADTAQLSVEAISANAGQAVTALNERQENPEKADETSQKSLPLEHSSSPKSAAKAAAVADQSDKVHEDSNAAQNDDWDAAMAAEEEGNQWLYSCIVCGDGGDVVMCEACPRVYHINCLGQQACVGRGAWHCPVCAKASRTQPRKKHRARINADAVRGPLEEIEKLCLTLPAGHFMAAMGTELRSARQTYAKCSDKGVEIADDDLPRIRDVSAWQRLLRAKLDEHEELEMSRRSRSRVVTKLFSPDQDRNSVVAQFHEQGITQLRHVLTSEQVNEAVGAVESRFNHVIKVVNTLSLQHILESVGFTTFKLRHVGRYDMVIPEFDTAKFAFLNTQATWMPTVKAILGDDCDCIYKGVMLSLPGSFPQPWHQDGPHLSEKKHLNAHCLNVFVPLVDLTTANGPTEFVPTTQILGRFDAPENPVAVCASAGDVVLMDYRIKHRGLGNNSAEPRPLLYITYAKKGWTDRANFSSRRYRALPELDDTDRFQPQVKRKFKAADALATGDRSGWTVVAELNGGELKASWQAPAPVLEVKIGLGVKHQGGQAGASSFDTKRKKGPLTRGEFCWPVAQLEKRYVGKGPLVFAVWDESFPERPSAWSSPFVLNENVGHVQLTTA